MPTRPRLLLFDSLLRCYFKNLLLCNSSVILSAAAGFHSKWTADFLNFIEPIDHHDDPLSRMLVTLFFIESLQSGLSHQILLEFSST